MRKVLKADTRPSSELRLATIDEFGVEILDPGSEPNVSKAQLI
jgi:hypothetical protein